MRARRRDRGHRSGGSGSWVWASGELAAWLAAGRWPHVPLASVVAACWPGCPPIRRPRPGLAGAGPGRAARTGAVVSPARPGPGRCGGVASVGWLVPARHAIARRGRRPGRIGGCRPPVAPARRPRPGGARRPALGRRRPVGRQPGSASLARPPAGSIGPAGPGADGAGPARDQARRAPGHRGPSLGPGASVRPSPARRPGWRCPALLEWRGPVIATSVKDDLAAATLGWRTEQGPCWVFDPTRTSGLRPLAGWSPLAGVRGLVGRSARGDWLVEATPARTGMADAAFWYAAAAKQLAPLLLAADRGGMTMADGGALDEHRDFDEPGSAAASCPATIAAVDGPGRLRGPGPSHPELGGHHPRDGAGSLRGPGGGGAQPQPPTSTSTGLLDEGGTLYLCGPSHEQHRVQGLFAALVSSVGRGRDRPRSTTGRSARSAPARRARRGGQHRARPGSRHPGIDRSRPGNAAGHRLPGPGPADHPLRCRAGPHHRQQSPGQAAALGASRTWPPSTWCPGLAGEAAVREDTVTHDLRDGRRTRSSAVAFRRLAPTDELRRIPPGEGVLVYGHLPPVRLRLRPWFRDRRLRARVSSAPVAGSNVRSRTRT